MKSTLFVPSKATHPQVGCCAGQSMCRLAGNDGECIYVMCAWVSCLTRIIRHFIVCVSVCTQQAQCHTCAHHTSYQYCYIEQVNAWGGCSAISQHISLGVHLTFRSVANFVVVCKLWKSDHASDIAYMHTHQVCRRLAWWCVCGGGIRHGHQAWHDMRVCLLVLTCIYRNVNIKCDQLMP